MKANSGVIVSIILQQRKVTVFGLFKLVQQLRLKLLKTQEILSFECSKKMQHRLVELGAIKFAIATIV